ncbi:hypothetical protein K458DRAFT_407584 [Lentithecium fluviatile CBS 122367]|uniref:Uncharacterized protein n=1 Tax=Lentithecium fluviatile CBS 122367 TaxID=1168545 RepID=A0A6G1IPX9_9PLEO|nr:hypothetical protein K458DRAFT_407584 [Lentithecium fluviatile CBS 122367]
MNPLTLLRALLNLTVALALPQDNPGHVVKDCIAFKTDFGKTPGPRGWGRDDGVCYKTPIMPAIDLKKDCVCRFFATKDSTGDIVWIGTGVKDNAVWENMVSYRCFGIREAEEN